MTGDVAALLAAVLLLAGNAFFVGAEFALITTRRDRLETLVGEGQKRAATVLRAGENLSLMLAASQLGITICSLLLGRLGEPAVAHLLSGPLEPLGVPPAVLHPLAFTVSLGIVVVAHMLLGEMVPKNIAIAGPERSAMLLVPPFLVFVKAARPVISLFNLMANGVLRLIRVEPRDELESSYTPAELNEMIDDSRREGLLDDAESSRLARTLSSAGRTVSDVLVPLARLHTLPLRPTVGEVADAVAATGFSRFPLRNDDHEMVGYLHVKDLLDLADQPSARLGPDRTRPLPDVFGDQGLDSALGQLRRARAHLARVVDRSGREIGLVAMEDLLAYYLPGRADVDF